MSAQDLLQNLFGKPAATEPGRFGEQAPSFPEPADIPDLDHEPSRNGVAYALDVHGAVSGDTERWSHQKTTTPSDAANWSAPTLAASGTPIVIAAKNPWRRSVMVYNPSTNAGTAYLGSSANITAGGIDSFPLIPGASITLETQDVIYAVAGATAVQIGIVQETWDYNDGNIPK